MHDLQWEKWLDAAVRDHFVAVYRPELPPAERLRAAHAWAEVAKRLSTAGAGARGYLRSELTAGQTQRRNGAARLLSHIGTAEDVPLLLACYVDAGRQWLAPAHLVRLARRHPLPPDAVRHLAGAPEPLRPHLARALVSHDRPAARLLLGRLLEGPDPLLAQAAIEEAGRWGRPEVLRGLLHRVDGTDAHPPALVPAAITAARSLAVDGDAFALDWLHERTGDPDPQVAAQAHVALSELDWPGASEDLVDLLEEARGPALTWSIEAAEGVATGEVVRALAAVIHRHLDARGPRLDDNPADQAIRVLERLTGRWVPVELCGYDRWGNLDAATRRRAGLLFGTVGAELDPEQRYRVGRPRRVEDLVEDLLDPHPVRVRRAAWAVRARRLCRDASPRGDLLDRHADVARLRRRAGTVGEA
jgi:hypothetical protein